jgi:hypothetical protein
MNTFIMSLIIPSIPRTLPLVLFTDLLGTAYEKRDENPDKEHSQGSGFDCRLSFCAQSRIVSISLYNAETRTFMTYAIDGSLLVVAGCGASFVLPDDVDGLR